MVSESLCLDVYLVFFSFKHSCLYFFSCRTATDFINFNYLHLDYTKLFYWPSSENRDHMTARIPSLQATTQKTGLSGFCERCNNSSCTSCPLFYSGTLPLVLPLNMRSYGTKSIVRINPNLYSNPVPLFYCGAISLWGFLLHI